MQSHTSRDAFYYILQFVTLAISSTALGNVWFGLIDRWTPSSEPYGQFYAGAVTGGLSALVIAGPVYLFLSWWIRRSFTLATMTPTSSLRKWLVYLTLFVTAIIGIVDLINTLQTYLNGDFTLRFFWKALTILIIAAAIFAFYLWDIRRDQPASSSSTRGALALAVIVFLLTVAMGFWVVGSPKTRRLLAWDQRRVNDIESIAEALHSFADKQDPVLLPTTFEEFQERYSYTDPEQGTPYEYRRIDTTTFELCTTFALAAEKLSYPNQPKSYPIRSTVPGVAPLNFSSLENHSAGHQCFTYKTTK